jgi:hypothetical protein
MAPSTKITFAILASAALLTPIAVAQPVREGGKTYVVTLTGEAEVPDGDPDGTGTAVITVNRGQRRVCWEITTSGIDSPSAAHIHIGLENTAPGSNIVVHLTTTSGCTTTVTPGGVPLSTDLLAALIQAPQVFYVNVHNAAFPAGAVRGQLA